MTYRRIGIAATAAVLLTACSTPPPSTPPPSTSTTPQSDAALPPPDAELRVAPAEESALETTGVSAETEESLSVEYISVESPSEPLVFAAPATSGWTHSEVPLTRQQNDIEACYSYAAAQVARDARIDYDRRQIRNDSDDVLGLTTLTSRVDYYSEPRRRANLFESCMSAKGYRKP